MQSFHAVMSWKLHPLVLLGVLAATLCRSENCELVMWTEPPAVLSGGSIEVFCRCNSSTVGWQDLTISDWQNLTVETNRVDDVTIKHRKQNVIRDFTEYLYCRLQDVVVTKKYMLIVPLIRVEELRCHFHPLETELSCNFSDANYFVDNKNYFLSINRSPSVPCLLKTHENTFHCPGIPIKNTYNKYNLTVDMEYKGYNQSLQLQLGYKQVLFPEWPKYKIHIVAASRNILFLIWPSPFDPPDNENMEWRVWYLPQNPRIEKYLIQKKMYLRLHPFYTWYIFQSPSFAHQTYKLRMSRRYPFWESPWSPEIETAEFVTESRTPDRPPKFLPNGFFHQPENGNLYVYWLHLDELEFNGPNFTYYVSADKGKTATILSNNSALFRDWDATKPVTVAIWSENSKGRSEFSSELKVPMLTNSLRHQARNLWYHLDNQSITWQPPMEQADLVGYTVSWCPVTVNSLPICDDHELIQFKVLNASELRFQFKGSMVLPNIAVTANYMNNTGGGMQWHSRRWMSRQDYEKVSSISLYLAYAVIVVLIAPVYVLIRNLRHMAQIDVDVPDILFKSMDPNKECDGRKRSSFVQTAVPGNFSPKAVMNIPTLPTDSNEIIYSQSDANSYVCMNQKLSTTTIES